MDYKPGDFFIGAIDFFGVVVPGAVLLFLQGKPLLKIFDLPLPDGQPVAWVAFAVGSYVLGNFLLGLSHNLTFLLRVYYPERKDDFYAKVKAIIDPPKTLNRTDAFYRAQSFVRLNSPSFLAEIERQEANYRLFRSLILVFALDCVLVAVRLSFADPEIVGLGVAVWGRLAVSGTLLILAIWRFLFLLCWTYRLTFEFYDLLRVDGATAANKSD